MQTTYVNANKKSEKPDTGNSRYMQNSTATRQPVVKKTDPFQVIQRIQNNPWSVTREDVMLLQSTIGYQATVKLLADIRSRAEAQKAQKEQAKAAGSSPNEGASDSAATGSKQENNKPEEATSENARPEAAETADVKPATGQEDTKAADIKAADTKQEDISTTDTKAADVKAADTKQEDTSTTDSKGAGSKSTDTTQAKTSPADNGSVTGKATAVQPAPVSTAASGSTTAKTVPSEPRQAAGASDIKAADLTSAGTGTAKAAAGNISQNENIENKSLNIDEFQSEPQKQKSTKEIQETGKASGKEKSTGSEQQAQADSAENNAEPAAPKTSSNAGATPNPVGGENASKKPAPAPKVKISGEDPGKVIEQLGKIPATEMVNAFSQATAVSGGALEKQRQKTQAVIPEIQTPTGLVPTKVQNTAPKTPGPIKHTEQAQYRSEKSGGKTYEGMTGELNLGGGDETDPDELMAEARAYAKNAPAVSMSGEADPSQMEGFKTEASQNVQKAKQDELAQTNRDFGENTIAPLEDKTRLKADKPIGGVLPLGIDIKQEAPIPPEVADRVNPSMTAMLESHMAGQNSEYQKGRSQFDTGVATAKSDADKQIETEKSDSRQKQLNEQANAKAEVTGYRTQWKNEINTATAEYDQEAGAEASKKKQEVNTIKTEKEGQVKEKLTAATQDAEKESKTAKKEAENKKQDGEKDNRNIFQKAWDWTKEKAKQAVDTIKKAVSFVFDKLRQAVKTIFEKAKQAALALIEAGRKLIVSAIKGLGTLLKSLVKKVFAKFPGISSKICGLIDNVVNKAIKAVNQAASLLKKGVTAALNFMAKAVDKLFAGVQNLYRAIMAGIKKFLTMDFKKIFGVLLEAAQIAAEIALAFATGGGSVLLQIVKWLATTLPQLFSKVTSILGFVNTIRTLKIDDVKQLLSPTGIGNFLVKGLFGELRGLPQAEEEKDEKEEKEPASGREEKGLMKVFSMLTGVFKVLKGVYGKVTGAINKVLPVINITNKPWFDPFSMIYAGVVKVIEVVKNPAEALNEGVAKLKEAAGNFFGGIKTKVTETAGNIKQKIVLLGQPAQLMKLIANKAVDMVLNFIITHPPSALIKAVFKGIEAVAGKSIVELVRQYIPFADKLFDNIAGSEPVQGLMKPLEGPVRTVGGVIDQVTTGATGMVDDAEQKTVSAMGSGAKLLTEFAGKSGGNQAVGEKEGGSKGSGKGEEKGGGDFLGTIKGGIHTKLLAFGEKLIQMGKHLVMTGVDKLKGLLTGKVKFKLGKETHELWVEKGKNKNVVMMASNGASPVLENPSIKERNLDKKDELVNKVNKIELKDTKEVKEKDPEEVVQIAETEYAGVSEAEEVKYGDHLTKDGRKTVLKPNVTYNTDEGYSYSTDEKGRIRSVEGILQLGLAERNEYAQKTVGREDRLSKDDGGHLIASIFKGSGGFDNLVAMDGNLNKGEWKKLENMWANALKGKDGKKKINPKPVKLDIEVVYKGDSQRPVKFNIVYQIGKSDPIEVTFLNKKGGK